MILLDSFESTRDITTLYSLREMIGVGGHRLGSRMETRLRVFAIFEGLIFTLFEVLFPFRFPPAVGENGKWNRELDSRGPLLRLYLDEVTRKLTRRRIRAGIACLPTEVLLVSSGDYEPRCCFSNHLRRNRLG